MSVGLELEQEQVQRHGREVNGKMRGGGKKNRNSNCSQCFREVYAGKQVDSRVGAEQEHGVQEAPLF